MMVVLILVPLLANGQMMSHSHHDFKSMQWSGTASCAPCHPSTNADQALSTPKWITEPLSAFETYSDSPVDRDPGSTSKLCLSCHDGTMGGDSYTEYHEMYAIGDTVHSKLNMMSNHPVSVIYNYEVNTLSRRQLNDPNTTMSGLGGTIAQDLLINGKVECTSCHDIHVTRNIATCKGCHTLGKTSQNSASMTLWITNDYSALCKTCHNK